MKTEKLFHDLLGLGMNWEVLECEFEKSGGIVRIRIGETANLSESERSPGEGARVKLYDHTEELEWRHLNVFDHRCEIRCRLPRWQRTKTGKVYRGTPLREGLSKHFTNAFEAFALLLMREMPVLVVSRKVKETDTRPLRMLKAHMAVAYPQTDWSQVVCVGCDEMSVRKGHRYITVFCNMIVKRVLFAVKCKDKSVWEAFARRLEDHHGHPRQIREVSMDMRPAYIAGDDENLGSQAQVVLDKFHVVAAAGMAVDETRLNAELGEELKQSCWIWLKNPDNHTEKQKIKRQSLEKQNLATARAYQMRLNLSEIYRIPQRTLAKRRFLAWCRWVRRVSQNHSAPLFAKMVACVAMIERRLPGILAYWERKTTNAYLEGLNSVLSVVKRKARGYRSTDNLITMLYFVAGNLRIPASH